MSTFEEGPQAKYELSLDAVSPADAAWLDVSAQVPMEKYPEVTGREIPEPLQRLPSFSLQTSGLSERGAAVLTDIHESELAPFRATLERMRLHLLDQGASEEEARHLTDVFGLGMLVGAQAVEITQRYAEQGLRQLEAGESD